MEEIVNFIFNNLFSFIFLIIIFRFFQKARSIKDNPEFKRKSQTFFEKIKEFEANTELSEEGIKNEHIVKKSNQKRLIPHQNISRSTIQTTEYPGVQILIALLFFGAIIFFSLFI